MSKKPTRISTESLEKLRARLEALPPKPKTDHSRQETVELLQAQIRRAVMELGYSFADIADFYKELGTEISPSSIASMLRELAPKASGKKPAVKQRKMDAKAKHDTAVPASQPALPEPQLFAAPGASPEDVWEFEDDLISRHSPDLR
jgi:hypothetical protein